MQKEKEKWDGLYTNHKEEKNGSISFFTGTSYFNGYGGCSDAKDEAC